MNQSAYPKVLPVSETGSGAENRAVKNDLDYPIPVRPVESRSGGDWFVSIIRGFFAWMQRWFVGALFCTTYFTAPLVVGWTYRWMQCLVVKRWWRMSRFANDGTIRQWCDRQEKDAPSPRPRWIVRERIRQTLSPEKYGKKNPTSFRQFLRVVSIPWHSLWLNLRTGVAGLLCTYSLTGWGCMLMFFGWIYGWHVSFHKIYEEAYGPGVNFGTMMSIAGIILFVLSLYYVLMAQVHQAVTGESRAFYDFQFVWNLTKARPTAYIFLFVLVVMFSLVIEVMKIGVVAIGNNETITNGQMQGQIALYAFGMSLILLPMWLLSRFVAARIYASAVLKVVRHGVVSKNELHPRIAKWLSNLEVMPTPVLSGSGIVNTASNLFWWKYRKVVYAGLFVFLVLWIFPVTYATEFLKYDPFTGFMNREMVQIPTMDVMPRRLISQPGDQK